MIGPESHLVTPINPGLFPFGLFPDLRIIFFKPAAHLLRIFLIGSTKWLLRREPPTAKIAPHRPNRETNPKSLLNQVTNRLSCPKIKRQFQLFRMTIYNRLGNLRRLPGQKRSSSRPASSFRLKGFLTSFTVCLNPFPNSLARDAENLCDFSLCLAAQNGLNRLLSKVFLCNRWKRTSISCFHARSYITNPFQLQSILCTP